MNHLRDNVSYTTLLFKNNFTYFFTFCLNKAKILTKIPIDSFVIFNYILILIVTYRNFKNAN